MYKLKAVLITASMLMLVVSLQPGATSVDSAGNKLSNDVTTLKSAKVASLADYTRDNARATHKAKQAS